MIFYKYHGTGNDFVIIDNRAGNISLEAEQIAKICKRHFGIGADGLILLEESTEADFKMVYYNADGQMSSMCGNGGRCIVKHAKLVGLIAEDSTQFMAADGKHYAKILPNGEVALKMNVNDDVELHGQAFIIDTGSPHYVRFKYNIDRIDMKVDGRMVRNSAQYKQNGINVNYVEELTNGLKMRTYERGVEDETLSCGTGVTAAAICWYKKEHRKGNELISVQTIGGNLKVQIENDGNAISNVWLIGPAQEVFIGEVDLD